MFAVALERGANELGEIDEISKELRYIGPVTGKRNSHVRARTKAFLMVYINASIHVQNALPHARVGSVCPEEQCFAKRRVESLSSIHTF